MDNNQQYGSITEQGDLSLGWNPFDKESNKIYVESINGKKDSRDQLPINETLDLPPEKK